MASKRTCNSYIIGVEGNIGAGKTTMIKEYININESLLKKEKKILLSHIEETLNQSLLTAFYNNPEKFSDLLQIFILMKKIAIRDSIQLAIENNFFIKSIDSNGKVISRRIDDQGRIDINKDGKLSMPINDIYYLCDRTIIGNSVFSFANFIRGKMTREVYNFYRSTFITPYMDEVESGSLELLIYLDTEIKESQERIKKRNREGEENISFEYLNLLDTVYVHLILYLIMKKRKVIVHRWQDYCLKEQVRSNHDIYKKIIDGERRLLNVNFCSRNKVIDSIDKGNIIFLTDENNKLYHMFRNMDRIETEKTVNIVYNDITSLELVYDKFDELESYLKFDESIHVYVTIPFKKELLPDNDSFYEEIEKFYIDTFSDFEEKKNCNNLLLKYFSEKNRRIIMFHLSKGHDIHFYHDL